MHCTMCQTSLGDSTKIQPTSADGETFCPACFVVRRMAAEPDRFNATQAAAVRCMLCGWMTVAFGVLPTGSARCGQCGQCAGLRLRLDELPLTRKEVALIEETARESGLRNPPRIKGARG